MPEEECGSQPGQRKSERCILTSLDLQVNFSGHLPAQKISGNEYQRGVSGAAAEEGLAAFIVCLIVVEYLAPPPSVTLPTRATCAPLHRFQPTLRNH